MPIQTKIRRRRETCWWEPTYNPALVGKLKTTKLQAGSTEYERCHFEGVQLQEYFDDGGSRIIRGVKFKSCDFQGTFSHTAQLVFDDCQFEDCDLGLSTWENVKFSKCRFNQVSLGQTRIINSEFRSCHWTKIGLSPNGTELESTYFSNSEQLIASAYTNLDVTVLSAKNASADEQISKLENTKATVARRILKLLQAEGDEAAFYNAVKTFQLQHAEYRKADAKYKLKTERGFKSKIKNSFSIFSWWTEGYILWIFGTINDWGASVVKPLVFYATSMAFFGFLYALLPPTKEANPIVRSFEISILAGYTNYGSEENFTLVLLQCFQILISIVLYSITFATILNRLSRVR